jgi:hypothetical protein
VIVKFLHDEKADVHDIAQRLQAEFAQDAYALRTVQFWIGEVRRGRQDIHGENCMGRPLLDDLDAKIPDILDKSPFESVRSIAENVRVGLTMVLRLLHDSISFRSFHFHSVPHVSTVELRENE